MPILEGMAILFLNRKGSYLLAGHARKDEMSG